MKFLLICIVLFVSLFALSYGADCNVKGHGFSKGEKYQPRGQCVQMVCEAPNVVTALGCPAEDTLKPCKYIPEDPSKPYPQCCPKFEC